MIRKIPFFMLAFFCSHAALADFCPAPNSISIAHNGSAAGHFVAPGLSMPLWVSLDPVESSVVAPFSISFAGATGSWFAEQTPDLISCDYTYKAGSTTYTINLAPADNSGLNYSIYLPLTGKWKLNTPALTCLGHSLSDCPIVKANLKH